MNWILLTVILLISIGCLFWPTFKTQKNLWPFSVLLVCVTFLAGTILYQRLGALDDLDTYQALHKEGLTLGQIVSAQLKPKEQVFALQKHLARQPKNHEGWHLLGQALVQLGEFNLANKAFARSMTLQPETFDVLLVDYAESLYLANQGFTPKVRELLKEARRLSTQNPKIDALYGFDAFHRKDYAAAKSHWEKAIKSSPKNSVLAKTLNDALKHMKRLETKADS